MLKDGLKNNERAFIRSEHYALEGFIWTVIYSIRIVAAICYSVRTRILILNKFNTNVFSAGF